MIDRLLVMALVVLTPAVAAADGGHGRAKPLGATSAVTVEGY